MLNTIASTPPSELAAKQKVQSSYNSQNQVNSSYAYSPDWMFENQNANQVGDDLQVSASNDTKTTENQVSAGCDDGNDDGRLSFGSALLEVGKGAVKSVWDTIKGIFTDPVKLVTTAVTAVACVAFPPLGVGLAAAGVVSGVVSGAKAVGKAVELYNDPNGTDAEAKAAFQDIGASALQVGVSVAGVKAGIKAMGATEGSAMAAAKGIKGAKGVVAKGKAFVQDTVTGGRGFSEGLKINTANSGYKATQMLGNLKAGASNVIKEGVGKSAANAVQNGVKGAGSVASSAGKAVLHPISTAKAGFRAYSNLADGAGYTTFGSLAAPVSKNIQETNEVSNYDKAQANKQVSSGYVSGKYEFSHEWMDKI